MYISVIFFLLIFFSWVHKLFITRYGSFFSIISFRRYFMVFIIFFTIFFFIKLFLNFQVHSRFISDVHSYNAIFCNSMFSDTLISLSVITAFISLIYLSERYLFRNEFSVVYFFIFTLCTIQMTSSDNLLTMFIYFEFLFLPSVYFVYVLAYSKKADATINFLVKWTLSGSVLVLFCLCYIYVVYGSLYINYLSYFNFSVTERFFLFWFLFVGFGVKLPIWPLYYWLTKVHVEAPTGFSIFLSGFLVKTALFCLIYFLFFFKNIPYLTVSLAIAFFGAIDASVRMWTSTDIKRLVAFATIQEMNLILSFLYLLNFVSYNVLNCFLLVHGLLSAFLFFLVDQVQKQLLSRNLMLLGGLSILVPLMSFFIWISLLIFRGFPTFIKFIIEWEMLALLVSTFGVFGFFFFLLVSFFGIIGFCRVWLKVIYGSPVNSSSYGFLKKDAVLAFGLSASLFGLNNYSFLF